MIDSGTGSQGMGKAQLTSGQHLPAFSDWLEYQLRRWDEWAAGGDSGWLGLASGNPGFPSLGHFMRHAFSSLHRYADQIAGVEPLDDSAVDIGSWDSLSAHAWLCLHRHREVCARQSEADLARVIEFRTRSAGSLTVCCAEALTHAATHCVWHLAGVAHLLRREGLEPPQRSDFIFLPISRGSLTETELAT